MLAELARARVVGARGGDLVFEVAQELLPEVADARVADLRLEFAARALGDAAEAGGRRRVLDALRRRRVLVRKVQARVLSHRSTLGVEGARGVDLGLEGAEVLRLLVRHLDVGLPPTEGVGNDFSRISSKSPRPKDAASRFPGFPVTPRYADVVFFAALPQARPFFFGGSSAGMT